MSTSTTLYYPQGYVNYLNQAEEFFRCGYDECKAKRPSNQQNSVEVLLNVFFMTDRLHELNCDIIVLSFENGRP